jgi:predicted RNA-binding protein YlqC (UPF0109 family)
MNSDVDVIREVAHAVLTVVKAMVDEPDAVRIDVISQPDDTLLRVRVTAEDAGKLIGINGRTARSLRIILGTISKKFQHPFTLDIPDTRHFGR